MTVTLLAVGDVFVDRDDPSTAFRSADFLRHADVLFGNCEGALSDDWDRAPTSGPPVVVPTATARAFADAGFDVLSLANNHIVDGGHRAMLDTRATLEGLGIATAGVGASHREAHAPALVESNGLRIAFLAYASVFPRGYEARGEVPGLAALRSLNHYSDPAPDMWLPEAPPVVTVEPLAADVEQLAADVGRAREQADVVVVSAHWGDMFRAFVVGEHERRFARLAVEAGADLVLGHHQHMLRGVEFYRGRPILYGLGHYVFDLPDLPGRIARDGGRLPPVLPAEDEAFDRRWDSYRLGPREGYPLLPFHPDGRLTGAFAVRLDATGVLAVGFAPAVIDERNEAVHVPPDSPDGERVLDYLREACRSQGFPVQLVLPTDETGLPPGSVQFVPADA